MVESGVTGPAAPDGDYDSADEYDEDMYKGEADRQELAQLNDLDREQILAERFEKHQRRQDALQVSSTTLSLVASAVSTHTSWLFAGEGADKGAEGTKKIGRGIKTTANAKQITAGNRNLCPSLVVATLHSHR